MTPPDPTLDEDAVRDAIEAWLADAHPPTSHAAAIAREGAVAWTSLRRIVSIEPRDGALLVEVELAHHVEDGSTVHDDAHDAVRATERVHLVVEAGGGVRRRAGVGA